MTLLIIPVATLFSAAALPFDDPSAAGATVSNVWTTAPLSVPGPAPQSESESPWYWSLGGSFVTTSDSEGPDDDEVNFDDGWGAQVAFGKRFPGASEDSMKFDVEIEGLYTDQEPDRDGPFNDLNTAAVMLNGLAAFPVGKTWELFFGGGLGLGWLDVGSESDSLDSFEDEDGPFFTWQARAGVRVDLAETTQLEVGYRYLSIDDAEVDDGIGDSDFDLETEQHSLGLNVRFGV